MLMISLGRQWAAKFEEGFAYNSFSAWQLMIGKVQVCRHSVLQ
jgi:hypothetical protein